MPRSKQLLIKITDADADALDHIKKQNALTSTAATIAYAVEMEYNREESNERDPSYLKAVESVMPTIAYPVKENRLRDRPFSMVQPKEFPKFVAGISEQAPTANATEAIRFAIRVQALLDGFKLPKSGW